MRRPLSLLSPRAAAPVLLVLALLAGACGDGIAPPAAEVNGNAITQSELDDELESIGANAAYVEFLESQGNTIFGSAKGTFSAEFVRRVLTRQIYLELVHAEYVKRKLRAVTKEDRDLVEQNVAREVGGPEILEKFNPRYRNVLLDRSAEVAKLQLDMSESEIDDATIRKFYDENQELFTQTCARHMLFAVVGDDGNVDTEATAAQSAALQAEAQAAKARLNAGEDFAAVAREVSKDRTNRDTGGDLQCGQAGRFVPEFETALDDLQPGQTSDPVQTQFGWHLIKVDARQPQAFEEVTDAIRQQLLGEAQQGFGTFLSEALTGAEITINPRYGRFSKEGEQPGVVGPSSPTTPDVGGPTGAPEGEPLPIDLGG